MNYSNYKITLDMHKTISQAMLSIKNDDTRRKLSFVLTDGGIPYQISEDCTAVLRAVKPDGTILLNDCTIIGNVIEYVLTPQTSASVGFVECELTLFGSDESQITSPRFSLYVGENAYPDSYAESTDEFTTLVRAINQTNNLDVAVDKSEHITELSITKKDGTTKTVEIYDGVATTDQNYDPESENAQSGTAVAEAVENKVDKVAGKGLSANDFTNAYKSKLDNFDNKQDKTDNSLLTTSKTVAGAINENKGNIDVIKSKIPNQATAQNQLADKNFVNSSISTNTAYFRGTFDVVDDLGLTYQATHEQVITALSTKITEKTNNDYTFVYFTNPTTSAIERYDRYKYSSDDDWQFEYTLNNSSFTAQQWAAISSGITSTDVLQISTNTAAIANKLSKMIDIESPDSIFGVSSEYKGTTTVTGIERFPLTGTKITFEGLQGEFWYQNNIFPTLLKTRDTVYINLKNNQGSFSFQEFKLDISNKIATFEQKLNKVTSINSNSTDEQYPSAKAVNNLLEKSQFKFIEEIVLSESVSSVSRQYTTGGTFPKLKSVFAIVVLTGENNTNFWIKQTVVFDDYVTSAAPYFENRNDKISLYSFRNIGAFSVNALPVYISCENNNGIIKMYHSIRTQNSGYVDSFETKISTVNAVNENDANIIKVTYEAQQPLAVGTRILLYGVKS